MRVYACGCSLTYGDELQDPTNNAWPMLLGKKFDADVINDAKCGGSNYRTLYQVIKHTQNNYDLYLVAWSEYCRFTFYGKDNSQINFTPSLSNDLNQKEFFYKEWGKILYSHWYNDLYAFKTWLQQIIQLQKILADTNYIMINSQENNLSKWLAPKDTFINSVKELVCFDSMNDDQLFDEYNEIQYYISLIDTSKFYQWNKFSITDLCRSFPCGPRAHILEQGHQHLADLIYQYVQNKISHS